MSDIAGYARITVAEIRAFTDLEPRFTELYKVAAASACDEHERRKSGRGWLAKLFADTFSDLADWHEIWLKNVPRYLRGDIMPDWAKRVRGMDSETVILIDIDDLRLLRWIAEEVKTAPVSKEQTRRADS